MLTVAPALTLCHAQEPPTEQGHLGVEARPRLPRRPGSLGVRAGETGGRVGTSDAIGVGLVTLLIYFVFLVVCVMGLSSCTL